MRAGLNRSITPRGAGAGLGHGKRTTVPELAGVGHHRITANVGSALHPASQKIDRIQARKAKAKKG